MNKFKKTLLAFAAIFALAQAAFAKVSGGASSPKIVPTTMKIWDGVPSMKGQSTKMDYYAPQGKNTGAALVICPGGSYHHLGVFHEGKDVALWAAQKGISGFVLKYRVSGHGHHHPAMLEDVQRAIQIIRENASQYGIDADKIGAIGFSAGGHLVLMAEVFGRESELEKLGIETKVSLAPNFIMPIYPVVSMQDDIAHRRSRNSLLHKDQSEERKNLFSMEMQAQKLKCPVFLLAAKDDGTVNYLNSTRLSEAMSREGVESKFILCESGGHGFGMGNNDFVHSTKWNDEWLWPWLEETVFGK